MDQRYYQTGYHTHKYYYFSKKWDRCGICNGWRLHQAGRWVPEFKRGK
ncbi:MAG: hypothetical protein HKL85_01230 [Acidimicrobiaceae bacterium]|nr:hypothetical protein [Acidimicrobiaceae bacterium]